MITSNVNWQFYKFLTAVQELFFWADVNNQLLSTKLKQNSALLIGLWQNTKFCVCKKNLMYICNTFVIQKLHLSFSSWVLQHVKFVMVNQHQMISKLIQIPLQNNKNTGFVGFPSPTWFDNLSVFDKWGHFKCLAKIIIQKKKFLKENKVQWIMSELFISNLLFSF